MVALIRSQANRRKYSVTLYQDVHKIPPVMAKLIGDITARFALVEHLLKEITRKLVGMDPKLGRVSVRQPRLEDFVDMIKEILEIEQIAHPANLDALRTRLKRAERYRDMVAHTVWQRHPETKEIYARRLSGHWPKTHPKHGGVSRRIVPEIVLVTPKLMRIERTELDKLVTDLKRMDRLLNVELRALHKRLCERLLQDRGLPDQRGRKRLIRLLPSQEKY